MTKKTEKWEIVDRVSWKELGEYAAFDKMLDAVKKAEQHYKENKIRRYANGDFVLNARNKQQAQIDPIKEAAGGAVVIGS